MTTELSGFVVAGRQNAPSSQPRDAQGYAAKLGVVPHLYGGVETVLVYMDDSPHCLTSAEDLYRLLVDENHFSHGSARFQKSVGLAHTLERKSFIVQVGAKFACLDQVGHFPKDGSVGFASDVAYQR